MPGKDSRPLRDRLQVTSPDKIVSHFNIMVYGDPGSGKTWLCGTAQDHLATSPVLYLDVEGGITTLRHRKDIEAIRVTDAKQLTEIWRMLEADRGKTYKTVVIDHLTELARVVMDDIMEDAVGKNPNQDRDVPSKREWGKSGNRIRGVVRAYRDLPMNVIFVAHAKTERDDIDGSTTIMPALSGQLARDIPGFLDVVGYHYTKEERNTINRFLLVQRTRKVIAKDRLGLGQDVIEDPTIPKIFDAIHNPTKGES